MNDKLHTSPNPSSESFGLGVEIGRIRANLDLVMQCLMVLLQRSLPTTSTSSASPPASTGTGTPLWKRLMSKLSTEALSHLLEMAGRFLLRKVLPAAIASALAAASGLGTMLGQWLGMLSKAVLGW